MLFANIIVETFLRGGPIMWPILACLVLALAVIAERLTWWSRLPRLEQDEAFTKALWDIRLGNFSSAWEATENKTSPFLYCLRSGLANGRTDPIAAMSLRAESALNEARLRHWILGTLVTLSPLLGLLGTVIGIMQSFELTGGDALAIVQVSGGVAEALIATAAGLGIAILCLLPYNFLTRRQSDLRHDLDQAINQTELALRAAETAGHRLADFQTPAKSPQT